MSYDNWPLLIGAVLIIAALAIVKYFTSKKRKSLEGFKGVNNAGKGRGWKIH